MVELRDKVIIVLGADGGVGRGVVKYLAKIKAKLVLGSLVEDGIKKMEEELLSEDVNVISGVVDVTDEESVKDFFNMAYNKFGKMDILLNLPGLSVPGEIEKMKEKDFDLIMDVNLKGSFMTSKYFIPFANNEIDSPLIINIGSMASKNANANAPIYCAAKASVAMFSRGLALQLKKKNIRVATVNPGGISTGFWGDRKVPHDKLMQVVDMTESLIFVMTRPSRVMVTDLAFESFELFKGN